jgi:hypothetical protein
MSGERSPYEAPQSKLSDPPPRPGSPYKAVALGLATDFGGTFALSIVLAFFYAMSLASSGMPQEEIEGAIQSVPDDSWVFWLGAVGGTAFSVLGGYVCARVARQSEYSLGVILAAITVVLGLVLFGGGGREAGMAIVLNAVTVAAIIAGAALGKKRNRAARRAAG